MTLVLRLLSKVECDPAAGCWVWTGARNHKGYGRFNQQGKNRYAHRVAYELAKGPIPEGMDIDHLCHNRACVNPSHLEAVSHAVNISRGSRATRTYCRNGHPWTTENTYVYERPGRRFRECRICKRDRQRARAAA